MRSQLKLWIRLLLLMMTIAPALAMAETGDLYQSGVEAFKKDNYHQALEYFRQAEAQGNKTPNLYYNIGATCYKMGRYREAEDAFQRLVNDPGWRALALYNLGLIAEATDDREAAVDYFLRSRDAADPSSRMKQKAAYKVEKLRPGMSRAAGRQWYVLLSAAGGYDDNAVLAPDDTIAQVGEEADAFTDLYALGSTYLAGNFSDGTRFDAGGYARFYADQTAYNSAALFADFSRNRQYDFWHLRAGPGVEVDFVDNAHYATTPDFKLALTHSFEDFRFKVDNELSWIAADDAYDYLSGLRNRCSVSVTRWIADGRLAAGYEFEYNDRENLERENEFYSYSPLRHGFYTKFAYRPASGWRLELQAKYRQSRYPDASRQINADGSVTRKKREDDRFIFSIRTGYALTGDLTLFAEYYRTDNDSNFPQYDYTSNQFMGGLEKTF
ncbi:MAG: tetratricopeptide repeat protein [Desulfobacteraceae bacterium]|nr:tetratricopeptide repeat protein [Desulfobacteraceae bacterium]